MPRRVQLSRRAGHVAEGDAVRVDRATVWGNPFRSDRPHQAAIAAGARSAADAYEMWLRGHHALTDIKPQRRASILSGVRSGLRGRNLACWCGPNDECHADVLLRFANSDDPLPPFVAPPEQDDGLPDIALSVRQPWAWAILFAGKDIENRDWRKPNPGIGFRGRVCIHASSGMTRDEYDAIMPRGTIPIPPAHTLTRGAIVGHVDVVDIVRDPGRERIKSPWFFGPVGLVLRDPISIEPVPCAGALGFFKWRANRTDAVTPPAKWMLPKAEAQRVVVAHERGLFDQ